MNKDLNIEEYKTDGIIHIKTGYRSPKNYEELISTLKLLPDKKSQLDYLFEYFNKEVKYDRQELDQYKINCFFINNETGEWIYSPKENLTFKDRKINRMAFLNNWVDENYDGKVPEQKEEVIKLFKKALAENNVKLDDPLTMETIIEYYGILGNWGATTASVLKLIDRPQRYENGLLKIGVCNTYSSFIEKVCKDINISVKKVGGKTPFGHSWVMIDDGDGFKHYDVTYSINVRDKYNGWEKKSSFNDWLGINQRRLLELQPERTIETIDRKPVEQLQEM